MVMAAFPLLSVVALSLVGFSGSSEHATRATATASGVKQHAPPQRLAVATMRVASRSLAPLADRSPDPHDIALGELAPRGSAIDHVWFVAKGSSAPEVAVAWRIHFAGDTDFGLQDRSALTLWHPVVRGVGRVTWVPHTLIRASPYPFSAWRSVRLADVTGDGHGDLLVTIECAECNHATATISVYRTGVRPRKIYGDGVFYAGKSTSADHAVHGRTISETEWGARAGLLWFDAGGYVWSPFRTRTLLRWTNRGWRTVERRQLPCGTPYLPDGFPYP
jgi:hypothetical protein